MIVRWGLDELPSALGELDLGAPFLVASGRWSDLDLPVKPVGVWREVPSDRVADAAAAAATAGADAILAVGGGSAIDLGKAISSETGLPLVAVPTTYAGAEWTPFFGIRDPDRKMRGAGAGANVVAAVYEPQLTLDLPTGTTVGTAMNALAHSAEALYVNGHNAEADEHALAGARLIETWLRRVVEHPHDLEARTRLLEGAAESGAALGGSMLALAHAMAQAVGGYYGIPHGAMNALCLPPALRFNAAAAAAEIAAEAAARPGNRANPRQATPAEVQELYESIW